MNEHPSFVSPEELQEQEYIDKRAYHWWVRLIGGLAFNLTTDPGYLETMIRKAHPDLLRYRMALNLLNPHVSEVLKQGKTPYHLDAGGGDGAMGGAWIWPKWGDHIRSVNFDISETALAWSLKKIVQLPLYVGELRFLLPQTLLMW